MIVLDTNVLSAVMQSEPDAKVVDWLDKLPAESVWTTAVTVFEVQFGLELLATGRRRRRLEDAFARLLEEDLQGRIIPFDQDAARAAAQHAAKRRASGRPVDFRDAEIAGIVSARRGTLATRNFRHFQGLDLSLVNPWVS